MPFKIQSLYGLLKEAASARRYPQRHSGACGSSFGKWPLSERLLIFLPCEDRTCVRFQAVCTWLLRTTSWWDSDATSDSWVYCTNNPSPDYLWLHLKQGKLQEEMETVGPYSTLPSGRASFRSYVKQRLLQPPRLQTAQYAFFMSPFAKSELQSEIQNPRSECHLRMANYSCSSAEASTPGHFPPGMLGAPSVSLLQSRVFTPPRQHKAICTHSLLLSVRKVALLIPGQQRVPSAHEDHSCGSKSSKGASA